MKTSLAVVLLMAAAPVALAGQCRQELRPLLFQTPPAPQDLATARALCRAEADAGDADSLYQLALMQLGLAGQWEPEAAIPMIREAASAGVPEAQYWLAWQSESGPLLPHDDATALAWYQRAASADHRLAIGRLAQAYGAGELGLQRDPLKAAEYKARQARCMKKDTGPQT